MPILPEFVLKLLLAVLIGGLIGAEREFRDRAAGFRTLILICVGATMFTTSSLTLGGDEDPVRIAAAIVSGIGFLGAGAILRDGGRITGLTTAATIWLTAALGMAIGGGLYLFAGLAAAIVLLVLSLFPRIEEFIDNVQAVRTYQVVCSIKHNKFSELEEQFRECNLKIKSHKQMKRGDEMIAVWDVSGSHHKHDLIMQKLFADPEVKEFSF
ncbi:MAG: MgtC/SapB family protein [Ardenticatenaceae bacterium]